MYIVRRLGIKRNISYILFLCLLIAVFLYSSPKRKHFIPRHFDISCTQNGNNSKTAANFNVPIDLVYLWVNGSDPKFILELKRQKALDNHGKYNSSLRCRRQSDAGEHYHVIVVYPVLHPTKSLSENEENIEFIFNVTERDMVYSVIVPKQSNEESDIMSTLTIIEGRSYISLCGYITKEFLTEEGKTLDNMYIVTVKPRDASTQAFKPIIQITKRLGEEDSISREDIQVGSTTQVLVYGQLNNNSHFFDKTLKNLQGYGLEIDPAVLVWSTDSLVIKGLPRANRFAENDQLKFSLRSVEKYASWIQHIYIITNDQTPSWLNTSNHNISVVNTEKIFPNKKDLPTFSSPAIESHMHRIPGLSETFIFMCDDYFFGQPITLRDFYTEEEGLLINWGNRVNLCDPWCPHTSLGNGICDRACDNTKCMWDHGDCGVITPARMKRKYPNGLFSGSLYHTMGMFNRCSQQSTDTVYYHEPRHSPLLVNRHIALDLENAFHEDFKKSSALHFRSQFNVQYSMAYLLYVSSAREVMTTESIFDEMDTDKSGTVSVEEEMEFLNDKGISKASMTFLLDSILQCSDINTRKTGEKQQITKSRFTQCPGVKDFISWTGIWKPKYKHTIKSDENLHFIMITNHIGKSRTKLSKLSADPRKFNAINDDMDHGKRESVVAQELLQNFYEKLFPNRSQYELRGP